MCTFRFARWVDCAVVLGLELAFQVDMRGTLFVIVCVIVCLVSFVGMRSRPWIGMGFPSRYASQFICDCMCHCLSRFARCIAQSSLDWNWPSKSTCVARYVSLYVLLVVHFVLHVGLRSRPWIGIGLPSAFCRILGGKMDCNLLSKRVV